MPSHFRSAQRLREDVMTLASANGGGEYVEGHGHSDEARVSALDRQNFANLPWILELTN
jgi:hypothetical protein